MTQFFASPAVQTTAGSRGKSTGRKTTKTVRGNDGAYCAQVKQELLSRPAWTAYRVTVNVVYADSGICNTVVSHRRNRDDAEHILSGAMSNNRPGVEISGEVVEVQMRFAWVNGDVKEVEA